MDPGLIDADLVLRFVESLLWAAVWVITAVFAGELLCIAVLCRWKRKHRAATGGFFDIS